jgi:hypothetical protein
MISPHPYGCAPFKHQRFLRDIWTPEIVGMQAYRIDDSVSMDELNREEVCLYPVNVTEFP